MQYCPIVNVDRKEFLSVSEFHTASLSVAVKYFQVTKTKAKAAEAKTLRRPIAFIRLNPYRFDPAGEMNEHGAA